MKLRISDLTKTFGAYTALDHLSLQVENTESLVFLGPSGGGKSTLLRIIAGLETPNFGSIELNGAPIVFEEPSLLKHRRSLGVVFQAFNLFPHLTALENIALPLTVVQEHSQVEANDIAIALLKRFKLEKQATQKPASLSGGQRQRIAIARAMATQPTLLLFDEPTSALDPEMTAEVLDMILELRHEGRKFVLVTHELGFARNVADQVAIISQGRIAEVGSPEQVFQMPTSELTRTFFRRTLKY